MIILEKGERADPLWGMDTEIITDEMIEALKQGKRLYLSVNDEYAVVIKKNGKRKTDKPEATDTDTISRQDAIEHLKKRLYESALNNEGVVSETMEEIADNRIQIWMDELPSSPSRPKGRWIPCTKNGLPLSEMAYREGQKWYGYKCSNCNFIYKGNALTESPYCQKCGADMRP